MRECKKRNETSGGGGVWNTGGDLTYMQNGLPWGLKG